MGTDTVEVTSYEELRELVGAPRESVARKALPSLLPIHRTWLAHSPFCMMATSGADGSCDVSPKGDPAGFTTVLDDATIAIGDRPGNRRADGFANILQNPHVGLDFLVPGRGDTLRINGSARLVREAPYLEQMEVRGHRPALAVEVSVEEVYFHCAKAFMRSDLWQPHTWDPDALPSRARIAKELDRPDASLDELERYYGSEYAKMLY